MKKSISPRAFTVPYLRTLSELRATKQNKQQPTPKTLSELLLIMPVSTAIVSQTISLCCQPTRTELGDSLAFLSLPGK